MKNVLIIGSTGQIGSELTMKLRSIYNGNIVAGYIPGAEPKGELAESGPSAIVDITNEQQIAETVSKYHIDTIYNLAALLSAVAEAKPQLAWKIGMGGLFNVLEVARTMKCAVFTPSSIGVFGNNTPKDKTPQDTIRNPRTMYGVTKVSGELLSDYYNIRFGVDTRSVRFPGLISYVTPPGGGTTDYAVDIYYSAAKGGIIAATKALAQEVAKKHVTVNAIAPGFIRTDMTDGIDENEWKKHIPAGRFGEPGEVAALVGFLASGQASYITGEVISINGGLYT